jgi:hypothetical protein
MLSPSPSKIHEPLVIGVSRDSRTGDDARNCETRASLWVPRTLTRRPTSAIAGNGRTRAHRKQPGQHDLVLWLSDSRT